MSVSLWNAFGCLDDIIHSMNWADHFYHLREVLSKLRWAGLTTKKCHLSLTEAQYLGYHIGWSLQRPQENKVQAVQAFLQPTNKKQPSLGWPGITDDLCLTSP